jgi:CheY-like chemotaxis protein
VLDDNEPVRRSIQTLLGSRKGWFVCGEAADGLQAVKEAELLRPDLIIMDVSMPKMNGLDAARIILREVREPRISSLAKMILQSYGDKQSKPVHTGFLRNRTFSAI